MPDLEKHLLGNRDVAFRPDCAFRRLLVDKSTVVGRLEVAVRGPRNWALPSSAKPDDVLSIADAYLNLPVRVPDKPDAASLGPLATQGRRLARLYEYATTLRQRRTEQKGLVEDGLPLLIIQADDGEPFVPPKDAKVIPRGDIGGADAAFFWMRIRAGRIPVWMLGRGQASRIYLRQLRQTLLRLHAEQQAVDILLRQIERGTIDYIPEDDPTGISAYLNEATQRIQKRKRGGVAQSAVIEASTAAAVVDEGRTQELMERLSGTRRQVASKIELYWRERNAIREAKVIINSDGGTVTVVEEQFNFSGVFNGTVVGKIDRSRIDGSFNTINNSGAAPELKDALKEVTEQISAMLREVGAVTGAQGDVAAQAGGAAEPATAEASPRPAGAPAAPPETPPTAAGSASTGAKPGGVIDAEDVMNSLEKFTNEAIASKPVKELVAVLGKKLIDVARDVAVRAGPVAAAVGSVLRLMGVPVPI